MTNDYGNFDGWSFLMLPLGAETASKTQAAENSLYVINHEEYRSRMVDAYDEVSCLCNGF